MGQLFQDSVAEIEQFYNENDYQLGWRFLNCSKTVLENNPSIAFITLNPGGDSIPADHPSGSCERGSSYLVERWGNAMPGQSNLQRQIQLMFARLAAHMSYPGTSAELIEETLSGYFVPFRSPRLKDLPHKREAFAFGEALWRTVLPTIRPKLFICIDRDSHKRLRALIPQVYGVSLVDSQQLATGWGKYAADVDVFNGGGDGEVRLLRLPHLSTFKLFSSANCSAPLERIFSVACAPLV